MRTSIDERSRTVAATTGSPQWADLPAEVLGNIVGFVHTAADAVRFHAVCWAWRGALHKAGYEPLLPWLLAPSSSTHLTLEDQRCRCVFSKETYRAPGICVRDRRVACTDGWPAWLVTGNGEGRRLVNPLTADRLDFPDECITDEWLDRRHRIIFDGGAVLLYDFDLQDDAYLPRRFRFRASLLPPDDNRWQPITSDLSSTDRCCAASYYKGGFVVCVDLANCHVIQPYWKPIGSGHYVYGRTREVRAALPDEPAGRVRRNSYLVECNGELLLASVLQEAGSSTGGLSVSLHELRLEKHGGQDDEVAVEWVRRDDDDTSNAAGMAWLGKHVLFLGFPASFAMEAAPLYREVSGGTAYFVIETDEMPPCCRVYRYSFHDGVATLVDTLPPGWHDARCLWFLPSPKIEAPFFQEGEEGSEPIGDLQPQGGDRSGARRQQQMRIYAGDLSPKVDNARLREMFSVYGKVAGTRVAYDKRGRSRGFGFVTMATQEGFEKAMAALNPIKEEPGDSFDFIDLCLGLLILFLIFVVLFYIFKGCKLLFLALFF
ncbi:hypothetical protein HU200_037262 [Digitaria exilis]|uniref:RRM domain-containing protein n=1 Tax=Digitaria exilis TaxID=1010633 RepID=A0A835BE71_9POAL|nr:hypothetical protein HU200_037262 [Digitaria exilis]